MTEINLPYDDWNARDDIRLERPSQVRAFHVVNDALDIGDTPEKGQRKQDPSVGPVINDVLKMWVAATEWLREYGVTKQEMEQAFNRIKRQDSEKVSQKLALTSFEETTLPADGHNIQDRIKKAGNEVNNF